MGLCRKPAPGAFPGLESRPRICLSWMARKKAGKEKSLPPSFCKRRERGWKSSRNPPATPAIPTWRSPAWALTNLSNPFQHRAPFARPPLLRSASTLMPAWAVSYSKLAAAKDVWESRGGGMSGGRLSVWNSSAHWRAVIYPLGVWVTYCPCLTQRCELQYPIITKGERGCWARLSYCMFSLHCSFGCPYNHIQHGGRGCLSHTPAPTAVFRVTERHLRIIDFVVQQR